MRESAPIFEICISGISLLIWNLLILFKAMSSHSVALDLCSSVGILISPLKGGIQECCIVASYSMEGSLAPPKHRALLSVLGFTQPLLSISTHTASSRSFSLRGEHSHKVEFGTGNSQRFTIQLPSTSRLCR